MADAGWRGLVRFRGVASIWARLKPRAAPALAQVGPKTTSAPLLLIGREDVLEQVNGCQSGTVVLAGDSGVGKTQLLTHAAQLSPSASAPVSLTYRQGGLQTALLSSLADVLARDATAQGSVDRMSRILGSATRKVADTRLEGISRAVRDVVVGVARDKLGDTIVDLGGDFIKAVGSTVDEQLVRRVTQASDPDVVEVFREFARQAAEVLGNPIILTLDAGERVHEDDFAQLLDLSANPAEVAIRIAFATRDDRVATKVRQLRIAGARVIELGPLDEVAVRVWLASEGVVGKTSDEVIRATSGYPLFILAAIEYLRNGGSIGDLHGHDGFVAQMQMNFHALNEGEHRACVALAGFTDPPEVEGIARLLGCTPNEWLNIESRLAERKIFPTVVNERPWFHELGRRAIWEAAMSPMQREASAEAAIEAILQSVESAGSAPLQQAIDVSLLFRNAPRAAVRHSGVEAVLGLSADELALYGAMLELTEEQNPGLSTSSVIEHARHSFLRSGDLEGQLRGLQESGLLALAENAESAVVVGVWPSLAARMVLIGMVSEEFGRYLLPRAATATFDQLLRPRLGQFHQAMYGLGEADLIECSAALRQMDFDRSGEVVHARQRYGLIARGSWGGASFFYTISFDEASERNVAEASLRGLIADHYYGSTFSIDSVTSWPLTEPVADLLLVQGALLATAGHQGVNASSDLRVSIAPPTQSVGEKLQLALTARSVLRRTIDPFTARVLNLDAPTGYVYFVEGRSVFVAEVRGYEHVIEIPSLAEPFAPFTRTRISSMAELPHDASIGRMTLHSGGIVNDYLTTTLNDARKRLKAFNDNQRFARKMVRLDSGSLSQELMDALDARARIAQSLTEEGLIAEPDPEGPYRHVRALIRPGVQRAGWVPGANGSITWSSMPADANAVEVEISSTSADSGWQQEDFRQRFGIEGELRSYSHSVLIGGLARLLGFSDTRISLEIPSE